MDVATTTSTGDITDMILLFANTAETGIIPPERALPNTRISGLTLLWSHANILPVLPKPV